MRKRGEGLRNEDEGNFPRSCFAFLRADFRARVIYKEIMQDTRARSSSFYSDASIVAALLLAILRLSVCTSSTSILYTCSRIATEKSPRQSDVSTFLCRLFSCGRLLLQEEGTNLIKRAAQRDDEAFDRLVFFCERGGVCCISDPFGQ